MASFSWADEETDPEFLGLKRTSRKKSGFVRQTYRSRAIHREEEEEIKVRQRKLQEAIAMQEEKEGIKKLQRELSGSTKNLLRKVGPVTTMSTVRKVSSV